MRTKLASDVNEKLITNKSYRTTKIINIFITISLMFLFGYLPPFPYVTKVGMKLLGVFLGVIYGYTSIEIAWPALLAIIAFGTSGYTDMGSAITSMFGRNIVFQCIVAFLSAGALTYYGFGKWFVRWSLDLPFFKGRPLFYTWTFMTFFGLSAIIINQIQLQIILYLIWADIASSCGYSDDSDFLYGGMAGILISTVLGGAMVPYTSWMYGLAVTWSSIVESPLNMGLMGALTIPITVVIISFYVLSLKFVFKIDFSNLKQFDVKKLGEEGKTLSPRVKRILITYLITVFIVILGNTLPNSWIGDFVNNRLTVAGCYAICAALLMIIPSGENDGKSAIVFNDIYRDVINWNPIFTCAVMLTIAATVSSEDTGIIQWVSSIVAPVFAGRSAMFVLNSALIVSMILTNLGSNVAFASAMIPIIAPFIMSSGMSVQLAGIALIYTMNVGLVLPGASSPASIFHSNAAIPNLKKRMKFTVFGCLIILITIIPIFSLLSIIF